MSKILEILFQDHQNVDTSASALFRQETAVVCPKHTYRVTDLGNIAGIEDDLSRFGHFRIICPECRFTVTIRKDQVKTFNSTVS